MKDLMQLAIEKENELFELAVDMYLDKTDADVISYLSEEDIKIYELSRRYMSREELTDKELDDLKGYLLEQPLY